MMTAEVAAKVKELEIHTKRILQGSGIGGSRTRQKGFGFEFDQLRSYQFGDDVRLIDWKSSARNFNNLLVRQYFEDRNRSIMICLDVSPSTYFGSTDSLKQDMGKQIAGALALAGQYSQDKVGLLLFSDHVEKMIPAAKGNQHVHGLLDTLFSHQPTGKSTDFFNVSQTIAARIPKRSIVVIISDFIVPDLAESLKRMVFDKEVIAITCADPQEQALANVGYVWMKDPETGSQKLVNTNLSSGRKLHEGLANRIALQKSTWRKFNVDMLHLQNPTTCLHDLLTFFQKRMI
jgi:uncharacterized protein (DUF58 family)